MQWEHGLLIIGIVFIIAAMFSLGRGRKNKQSGQTTARDHVERARQKQGVRDELEALMVDINRMARDLGAQLDAKVLHIERAVREADERIAQLQALRDELASPAGLQPQQQQPAPNPSYNQPHDQAYDAAHGQPDLSDPLTREVYALADQGIGPGDIAEQLGEHVGKVELILALRGV